MPRQKQIMTFTFFCSRNTPPGRLIGGFFYPEKNTKSIVYLPGEGTAGKASTPGKDSEPRTGGEAVVSAKKGCYKKSLCKLTKNNNKKISLNLLTNTVSCVIIQIQTKERGTQQCMLTPHLSSSGLSPLLYLLLFPC